MTKLPELSVDINYKLIHLMYKFEGYAAFELGNTYCSSNLIVYIGYSYKIEPVPGMTTRCNTRHCGVQCFHTNLIFSTINLNFLFCNNIIVSKKHLGLLKKIIAVLCKVKTN